MGIQPVSNRSAGELKKLFGDFLRCRGAPTEIFFNFTWVFDRFIKIAQDSGLLALPTVIDLNGGAWGCTFNITSQLTDEVKLTLAFRQQGAILGVVHEIEPNRPLVYAVRSRKKFMFEMCRPDFPSDPPRLRTSGQMMSEYTSIITLALLLVSKDKLVPQGPHEIHWR